MKKADPYMGVIGGPLDFNLYEVNFIVENLQAKHGSCVKRQPVGKRKKRGSSVKLCRDASNLHVYTDLDGSLICSLCLFPTRFRDEKRLEVQFNI